MPTADQKDNAVVKNEDAKQEERIPIPAQLPVLPLRDVVAFPFMILPLLASAEKAILAVDQSLTQNRMILLLAQRNQEEENPSPEEKKLRLSA